MRCQMDSICGRELIDVSSALGSPIVVVMGGGLGRCTLTTPTDHTSPPPLKLLLYSMQSDKSNSEIGFENPNENHVQGEFSQEIYASQEYVSWWFYCHQKLVLGQLAGEGAGRRVGKLGKRRRRQCVKPSPASPSISTWPSRPGSV